MGAKTNMSYNCLDRNIEKGLGDKLAFAWEGNSPEEQGGLTYSALREKVRSRIQSQLSACLACLNNQDQCTRVKHQVIRFCTSVHLKKQ
eukprot:scaffold492633_cov33-Prasinocladus_malaysianus.AAC.1